MCAYSQVHGVTAAADTTQCSVNATASLLSSVTFLCSATLTMLRSITVTPLRSVCLRFALSLPLYVPAICSVTATLLRSVAMVYCVTAGLLRHYVMLNTGTVAGNAAAEEGAPAQRVQAGRVEETLAARGEDGGVLGGRSCR